MTLERGLKPISELTVAERKRLNKALVPYGLRICPCCFEPCPLDEFCHYDRRCQRCRTVMHRIYSRQRQKARLFERASSIHEHFSEAWK